MDYIFDPHVPGLLMFQAGSIAKPNKINLGNLIEATTNLTAYLAIVTAGIALYVARFTLRAQVRSKSRQEWIDRFRSLIAAISSQVDRKFRADTEFKLGEVNEKIIHLELMLNPSEKDHRVLAMLLRICVHDQAPVEADKNLQAELASLKPDNVPEGSRDLLMFLAAKTVPGDDVSHGKAISYIVRLSNIILKREWMRVREIE